MPGRQPFCGEGKPALHEMCVNAAGLDSRPIVPFTRLVRRRNGCPDKPTAVRFRFRRPLSRQALSVWRSEEHTSELQSLMRISYAVFCLNKKKNKEYTR